MILDTGLWLVWIIVIGVTRSFEERIAETGAAKKLAEENVEKTNMEIDNLDHNIKSIKRAINEKTNPLKVMIPLSDLWESQWRFERHLCVHILFPIMWSELTQVRKRYIEVFVSLVFTQWNLNC